MTTIRARSRGLVGEGSEVDPAEVDPADTDRKAEIAAQTRWPITVREVARWVTFVAGTALFLRPILITAIVADDFLNPFYQIEEIGLSPTATIEYGWNSAGSAGHFNYLGQVIGSLYTAFNIWLASEFGIRFSTMYAVLKLLVFIAVVVASGRFLRECGEYLGKPISAWHGRVLVAMTLFGTLQLHNFWSNDPVGSYPLAGFGAMAIGMVALTFALSTIRVETTRGPWLAGLLCTAALLYYEINVAVVAAVVVVLAADLLATKRSRSLWPRLLHFAPMVAIPTVVTIGMQLRSAPASANYEGTAVQLDGDLPVAFFKNVVSSLPGSAWHISREYLQGPLALRAWGLVSLGLVAAVLATLAITLKPMPEANPEPSSEPIDEAAIRWRAAGVVAALSTYWLGATFIQTATAKVQAEVTRIGQVYNYYAIGATAVAVLLALAVHAYAGRVPRIVKPTIVLSLAMFVLVQYMITWNISERFNAATIPNQQLLVAYTEDWPMVERCTALWNWTAGAWPEYYEVGMIEGLETAYRRFEGEPFCEGFVRPP